MQHFNITRVISSLANAHEGDDTDTTAVVTGALAGLAYGPDAIPSG
ncbi:MAG: ADP-ribosylglycohydrolase family protein [Spirochaetaceae bacterium]|nr:ADP-ribosylglycohydrolase family protein [Spirochaetaceae bacterium]